MACLLLTILTATIELAIDVLTIIQLLSGDGPNWRGYHVTRTLNQNLEVTVSNELKFLRRSSLENPLPFDEI